MPQYIVVSEKEASYRSSIEAWTNRYVYRGSGISEEAAQAIFDEILQNERALHGPAVRFTRISIATPRNTPVADQFYDQREVNDPVPSSSPTINPEIAVLFQAPAGRSTLNRPVYLRKWYHPCANTLNGGSISTGALNNQTEISAGTRDLGETVVNNLLQVGPGPLGDVYSLEADSGRTPTGDFVCYPWVEARELGDQWRA